MHSESDKTLLLKLSRSILEKSFTLSSVQKDTGAFDFDFSQTPVENNLPVPVFVTLTNKEALRGCVGILVPKNSLADTIASATLQSAFEDPRFPPLNQSELPDIQIEISLLSPMRRIRDAGEITPNLHGVYVRKNDHTGLFLPQVWEQIPDKEQFLNLLCQAKAGLPQNAWKGPQVEIFIFTVEKIVEPSR